MVIRKLFKFEGAHIVRNCSSERCKRSIHGHSYVVEAFFKSKGLDNGQMVMDFGLMKGTIKDFIDGFDHAYSMWTKEQDEFKTFMKDHSDRWIEMPVSPSAEAYSLMFFKVLDSIVQATEFNNGEKEVELYSVRVHETTTGYAESFREDLEFANFELVDIDISDGIKSEWKDPEMFDKLLDYHTLNLFHLDNNEKLLAMDLFKNGNYSNRYIHLVLSYLDSEYKNSDEWADKDHSGPFDMATNYAEDHLDRTLWLRKKPFINPVVEQQV